MPDAKKTKSAAVHATDERPIEPLSEANFCPPNVFFIGPFVTIHWTHFSVNSICSMSFSPQKKVQRARCSIWEDKRQRCHINHLLTMPQYRHCLQILTGCPKINFLHNVYFAFFDILKIHATAPFCNLFIERPL